LTWISASASASRFSYQLGFSGVPPFDANHPAISVGAMNQRRRARLAGLASARRQQQDRRTAPVVAVLAVGLAVDADVLGAEQLIVVWLGHRKRV
jgi:hypothetical protein